MLLFAATVFLSAFLLFQIQPIIAKMILPWFGGMGVGCSNVSRYTIWFRKVFLPLF
jgi:hypothetical protein